MTDDTPPKIYFEREESVLGSSSERKGYKFFSQEEDTTELELEADSEK